MTDERIAMKCHTNTEHHYVFTIEVFTSGDLTDARSDLRRALDLINRWGWAQAKARGPVRRVAKRVR